MKFLRKLFKKQKLLSFTISNRDIKRVRAYVARGFKAVFDSVNRVWIITKLVIV